MQPSKRKMWCEMGRGIQAGQAPSSCKVRGAGWLCHCTTTYQPALFLSAPFISIYPSLPHPTHHGYHTQTRYPKKNDPHA